MKNNVIWRACLTLVVGALVLAGALSAPAQASTPGEWNLGYTNGNVANPGDPITNTGATTLVVDGIYNGVAAKVTCTLAAGDLEYDVASPVPSAPPGGSVSLPFLVTVATIGGPSNSNGTCSENVSGNPVTVTIPSGTIVTVTVEVPGVDVTSPSPWLSSLSGSVHIPQNVIKVTSDFLPNLVGTTPCVIEGPTDDGGIDISGSYDPGTGTAQATDSTPFGINSTVDSNPPCGVEANGNVDKASKVTIAGPGGLAPTAVYVS